MSRESWLLASLMLTASFMFPLYTVNLARLARLLRRFPATIAAKLASHDPGVLGRPFRLAR